MIKDNKLYEEAKNALALRIDEARRLVNDPDAMDKFLQQLEVKLKEIPTIGEGLSNIPVLINLVKDHHQKKYELAPIGTICAAVGALLYWVAPIDLIPDAIPVAGMIDDAAVVLICMSIIGADVETYKQWRLDNGLIVEK